MSLVMSSGKSLTHDNYAVIVFNLFGLRGPLNTQIYTPSPCLQPPHHPHPQTVQLARSRLHALNDHMHLSVSAQLMIMMAVCVFCFFLSVCVPPVRVCVRVQPCDLQLQTQFCVPAWYDTHIFQTHSSISRPPDKWRIIKLQPPSL